MTQNKPTAYELVSAADEVCVALTSLLHEENQALKARDVGAVDHNLKEKRRLGAKMEGLLKIIKASREVIKADPHASMQLGHLQSVFDTYQKEAKKNVLLLQAAHEGTASFLGMVKQAVEAKKPKANTYGKNGQMTGNGPVSSLLNKDV